MDKPLVEPRWSMVGVPLAGTLGRGGGLAYASINNRLNTLPTIFLGSSVRNSICSGTL